MWILCLPWTSVKIKNYWNIYKILRISIAHHAIFLNKLFYMKLWDNSQFFFSVLWTFSPLKSSKETKINMKNIRKYAKTADSFLLQQIFIWTTIKLQKQFCLNVLFSFLKFFWIIQPSYPCSKVWQTLKIFIFWFKMKYMNVFGIVSTLWRWRWREQPKNSYLRCCWAVWCTCCGSRSELRVGITGYDAIHDTWHTISRYCNYWFKKNHL